MTGKRYNLPAFMAGHLSRTFLFRGLDMNDPHDRLLAVLLQLTARVERRRPPWDQLDTVDAASSHRSDARGRAIRVDVEVTGLQHTPRSAGPAGRPARTSSVDLVDGSTVTVPEPTWCTGDHEDGLSLADLVHDGPIVEAEVTTESGDVTVLDACLTQYPYSANPDDRGVRVAVLLGNEWYRFNPDGLFGLADALTEHAVRLRVLARELSVIENKGADR